METDDWVGPTLKGSSPEERKGRSGGASSSVLAKMNNQSGAVAIDFTRSLGPETLA